ncbi:hypothetical protein [Bacillus altitudinis]|uniref:hypothetical protein n=1 Tax=Bacillus altitudinis TaxID=293387 RepID=UPI00203FC488|nr:hypothetical protein [Bacillus altitudinis]MCM3063797.1 hypothetical protein [Bacillus altitudinis]MCM3076881.1 hypothetical protein [Bacillus altitudinis]
MKENTWIEGWFEKCEELEIKPWEWDFKQSYIKEPIPKDKSSIELILDYKSRTLKEIGICNVTKKTGRKADCDKEPFYIYQLLWSTDYKPEPKSQLNLDRYNLIRGETMNSFWTTFKNSVISSKNKNALYNEIGININPRKSLKDQCHLLISNEKFKEFKQIKDNIAAFEKFATATHCIGNFTVLPHWMNSGRRPFSEDYWDVTLQSFFDFFKPMGCWKDFVEIYFLQPYVNNDNEWTVSEFWEGHFLSIGKPKQLTPQNQKELSEYLHKVNFRIEERGKWIIKKVCEELKLQHFKFYNELKDMQIRFSNEMN